MDAAQDNMDPQAADASADATHNVDGDGDVVGDGDVEGAAQEGDGCCVQ